MPRRLKLLSNVFCAAGLQALKSGIEDLLVSQPFGSWNWKFSTVLERGGEGIHLQPVGFGVGDSCSGCFVALAQAEFDGMVDRQPVVGVQHARFADDFEGRAIVGAGGNDDGAESAAGEFESDGSGGFDGCGAVIGNGATGDANDFILQDEAERVDAVHADIGDGAASRQRRVSKPCAAVVLGGVTELRAGVDGAADGAGRDLIAEPARTVLETEDLGDAEEQIGRTGRGDHLAHFGRVHGHGLFA